MTKLYTDEQLLQALRDLAAELGRAPTGDEMQARPDLPSTKPYYKRLGGWNAALKAAGLEPYRRPVLVYSDEQLLQILRDLAAELGHSPRQSELKARPGTPALNTYERRFGSWTAALKAAGLKPYRRRARAFSDEQLLQALRDLTAELGRPPTKKQLQARPDLPPLGAYYARFGRSWTAALKAAGIEGTSRSPNYSDAYLLQILRDLAAELGRPPSDHQMQARRDLPSVKIYYKRFGGWNAALKAAGLPIRRPFSAYSDEQLLQILRDLANELGRSPRAGEMQARSDLPSPITYRTHFGSWPAALEAAGLEPYRRSPVYSDEQLLQILRDLAAELGQTPVQRELQARQELPSPAVYTQRFGKWTAALQAAGLEPRRRAPAYSDEQLLQILRDLAAELGRAPLQRELQARQDLPSYSAYRGRFGSWTAALKAAGLEPYRRRAPAYSVEQLLQILRDLAAELGRSPLQRELQARQDLPSSSAYARCFGSWTAALEAAELEHRRRPVEYSDEQLLQILRDLAAELGRTPLQRELQARQDLPSYRAYYRRFGSWAATLQAAGLKPYRAPTFSDEQLLQILRDLAAELGRAPTPRELRACPDLPSTTTYRAHFGSWAAALQAVGLEPYRAPTFSDEQLLQILRDLAAGLGRSPLQRELQARQDLPSSSVYTRRFGGWTAALEAAGLKPYRRAATYSVEQLLQALRDLAAELGRSPLQRELQARQDLPSSSVYNRCFGSWTAALEAAGLEPYRAPTFSAEQLLQTLRDLAAELGRTPTASQMRARRDLPSPAAYARCFGSWTAALKAAGLQPRRRAHVYSEEQLLQNLRDLAAELGRSPMPREMQTRSDLPSSSTYTQRFGSWNAALEAAGLEPYRRPTFSDEQLLQILRDLAAELGRTPLLRELQARSDLPSSSVYTRRFGGWNAALQAAGLELNRVRRT